MEPVYHRNDFILKITILKKGIGFESEKYANTLFRDQIVWKRVEYTAQWLL